MSFTGTYESYLDYGGELDEVVFVGLIQRATSRVIRITGSNIPKDTSEQDAFNRAVYAAVDIINDNRRGAVTSWRAGDASKTYGTDSPNVDTINDRIIDELRNGGSNLLDMAV